MRSAHTVEQIRAAEAAHRDVGSGALMQRAAAGLASTVGDFLGGIYGKRVVLLVGAGDNGGDALYAGATLARRGASVEAWLVGRPAGAVLAGSSAAVPESGRRAATPAVATDREPAGVRVHEAALAALRGAGGRVSAPRPLRAGAVDVVIDGIVGIGGRPGLPAHVAEVVIPINPAIPIVAVDVPSGVDADTGELSGMAIRADLTVTFGTYRIAHLADPAAGNCGVVELVDLGLELPSAPLESLQAGDVAALLPSPTESAQKYTRGVVGVRAGSATYPGAALLAVAGASTGLAGMVRYVGSAADQVKVAHPEVVGAGRVQAWVVGPGGGADAAAHLSAALADHVPVVVDADALPHLRRKGAFAGSNGQDLGASAGDPAHSSQRERPFEVVMTPHAGELAHLLGVDRREVEGRPLHFAREAAQEFDAVVLLKGRRTVIADRGSIVAPGSALTPGAPGATHRPDGHHAHHEHLRARINPTGTPWLATAGAGDVLAGLIGSLLASGLTPFDAASVGAWLHGAAASQASAGGPLTASRVARAIPAVVGDLLS